MHRWQRLHTHLHHICITVLLQCTNTGIQCCVSPTHKCNYGQKQPAIGRVCLNVFSVASGRPQLPDVFFSHLNGSNCVSVCMFIGQFKWPRGTRHACYVFGARTTAALARFPSRRWKQLETAQRAQTRKIHLRDNWRAPVLSCLNLLPYSHSAQHNLANLYMWLVSSYQCASLLCCARLLQPCDT